MTDERINELIAELMEPKPEATKTYKQLEKEDGGQYGCWSIYSPGAWWAINIDWGRDRYRADEIAEWTPANDPVEEISEAFEVVEKMRTEEMWLSLTYVMTLFPGEETMRPGWEAVFRGNERFYGFGDTAPRAIVLAALKAAGVEIDG